MSNGIQWEPARKFPGYEVSRNHLVRNSRTKRIVPQRYDRYDKERRLMVNIIYRDNPRNVFVQELVHNAFGKDAK